MTIVIGNDADSFSGSLVKRRNLAHGKEVELRAEEEKKAKEHIDDKHRI